MSLVGNTAAIRIPIRMPVEVTFKAGLPFIVLLILSLAVLAFVRQISLWLPLTMSGKAVAPVVRGEPVRSGRALAFL